MSINATAAALLSIGLVSVTLFKIFPSRVNLSGGTPQSSHDVEAARIPEPEQEGERTNTLQPLRVFGGRLYDLSEPIWFHRGVDLDRCSAFWVYGKILSVNKDGILLKTETEGPGEVVFLVNHPTQKTAVDGETVWSAAFLSGRYQYKAASGALRTVPLYNYGVAYSPRKNGEFQSVTKILTGGNGAESETVMPFAR